MSPKAIVGGLIVTLLIGLSGQVVFVLIASYVGMAAEEQAFIQTYKQEFWFALGMGAYCISLILGGAVTSFLAKHKKAVLHGGLVGGLAAVVSALTSGDPKDLTYMAAILVVLGVVFGALGARLVRNTAA